MSAQIRRQPAGPAVSSFALWRDKRGRVSAWRIATLCLLVWPAVLAAGTAATVGLGGRPVNDLIHRAGYWALIFLFLSLAITPFRRSLRLGRLIDVRRMIGVASFAYALAHLCLYIVDQGFDLVKVASEIVLRPYLVIGFIALLGLTALAATSTDAMTKRIGGLGWRKLHQAAYLIGAFALIHYFQQTKADVSVPILYTGLFAWLIGYRLLSRFLGDAALGPAGLAGLTVVTAALTFAGEALGFWLSFGVPPGVFLANVLDPDAGIRPGWIVLAAGLAVVVLDLARGFQERRRAALGA